MTPWSQTAVVYQIYPRSFQDTTGYGVGDLAGIESRLDYLAGTLGVDAVWISPFYPSPMADFGYDVADYCNVDPLFGTLADFDRMVAAAHDRRWSWRSTSRIGTSRSRSPKGGSSCRPQPRRHRDRPSCGHSKG